MTNKVLLIPTLLFSSLMLQAQTLSVYYQFKSPKAQKKYAFMSKIDPDGAEKAYALLNKIQEFKLVNSQGQSRFTYVPDTGEHMELGPENPWKHLIQKRFESIEVYKNFVDGYYEDLKDLGIQRVVVKRPLKKPNWEVTQEKKHIGKYQVIKAYKADERSPQDSITAWFAPELPTFDGPFDAWGLPGLILEYQSKKGHAIARAVHFSRQSTKLQPIKWVKTISYEKYKSLTRRRRSGGWQP